MKNGIVLLHTDFCDAWVPPLLSCGIDRLGLHLNPLQGSVDDYLVFLEEHRAAVAKLQQAGVAVEHALHAAGYLLPRALFAKRPALFRQNEAGERTPDYNGCFSSADALRLIEENAQRLAQRLRQTSHRYRLWADDDLGDDVRCHCRACRALSATQQTLRFAQAVLRGLRRVDAAATLALLVYGEESPCIELPDGLFWEFAPFRRQHDLPLTQGGVNARFAHRLRALVRHASADRVAVLEYFLSYDYAAYCKDGSRMAADVAFYRSLGIERIDTFAVFPQRDYLTIHGFDGIKRFILA